MNTGEVQAARVAVLGAGAIAQVVHLPILTRMRGVQVVGLCDADPTKAASVAKRFSIPRVYTSPDELWDDDDAEGVIVCTPSNLHEQQVIAGLSSNKYVFCEKPLALSHEGAGRVVEAVGTTGRLMVGMNQRFRPDAAALKTAVSTGEVGGVHYVRAGWLNRRAGRSPQHWRQMKERSGGGALMDLGIQMLDLALWVLDYPEPRRVVAHLHSPSDDKVEDSAVAILELSSGCVINLEVTWTLVAENERQYLQAIGSTGSAGFPPLKIFRETEEGVVDAAPELSAARENPFTASYRQELIHFIDAVRGRNPIETPSEQTTLMEIVEGIYRSAEDRKEFQF